MASRKKFKNGERLIVPKHGLYLNECCDCGAVHIVLVERDKKGRIIERAWRFKDGKARKRKQ